MKNKNLLLIVLFFSFTEILWGQEYIPMTREKSGVYTIPCEVNGLKLKFFFDTGASDVNISLVEALFMYKNGYLSDNDIVGTGNYSLADGTITKNTVIILRKIKIGNTTINNVKASVSDNLDAPLLLGQSAISKLGEYTIRGNYLILGKGNSAISNSGANNNVRVKKTLTWKSGDKYVGETKNGWMDGEGTYYHANGDWYEGSFIEGKRFGDGTYHYKEGGVYKGEWIDNKCWGKGEYFSKLGDRYVGYYYDGKREGEGTFFYANGSIEGVIYKNGVKVKTTSFKPADKKYIISSLCDLPFGSSKERTKARFYDIWDKPTHETDSSLSYEERYYDSWRWKEINLGFQYDSFGNSYFNSAEFIVKTPLLEHALDIRNRLRDKMRENYPLTTINDDMTHGQTDVFYTGGVSPTRYFDEGFRIDMLVYDNPKDDWYEKIYVIRLLYGKYNFLRQYLAPQIDTQTDSILVKAAEAVARDLVKEAESKNKGKNTKKTGSKPKTSVSKQKETTSKNNEPKPSQNSKKPRLFD